MEADQIVSINYAEYRDCKVCALVAARWLPHTHAIPEECWNSRTKVAHLFWDEGETTDETLCGRRIEGRNWLSRV